MSGIRWDRDIYATRAVTIGRYGLFSTRGMRGDGARLPRSYALLLGGWTLRLERRHRA